MCFLERLWSAWTSEVFTGAIQPSFVLNNSERHPDHNDESYDSAPYFFLVSKNVRDNCKQLTVTLKTHFRHFSFSVFMVRWDDFLHTWNVDENFTYFCSPKSLCLVVAAGVSSYLMATLWDIFMGLSLSSVLGVHCQNCRIKFQQSACSFQNLSTNKHLTFNN